MLSCILSSFVLFSLIRVEAYIAYKLQLQAASIGARRGAQNGDRIACHLVSPAQRSCQVHTLHDQLREGRSVKSVVGCVSQEHTIFQVRILDCNDFPGRLCIFLQLENALLLEIACHAEL